MKRGFLAGLLLTYAMAIAPAFAQEVRLRSVRVDAPDVARTAAFYQAAFGLKEVRRVDRNGALFEVIMNQGATTEAAAMATTPRLVVILRGKDAPPSSVSNLIFGVEDLDGVISRATAAGGVQSRATTKSAASGSRIAFVRDPSGNEIELIEE